MGERYHIFPEGLVMSRITKVPWKQRLMMVAAAVVVGFSSREAVAATQTLRKVDCDATNWCSGGSPEKNCNDCCYSGAGLCYSYDPGIQGCLCW